MTKPKTAIIVGSGGQDGRILWSFLEQRGYKILGISRTGSITCGIPSYSYDINILDSDIINSVIEGLRPDELYYLAAYHHSSQDSMPDDGQLFVKSRKIHVDGYFNILQAIQKYSLHTKICYASSCLIYGGTDTNIQHEHTLPSPNSPYGITKLEAMYLGNRYSEKYGLHIVNAILYNHESEYRSPNFVSMKIIQGAINIKKGLQDSIILGDLSTQVDRGYAGDYVEAMRGLLQTKYKGDYIISSGNLHTIQDMVEIVFNSLGLDWKQYIQVDPKVVIRKRGKLFGDNSKIKKDIGREPRIDFSVFLINMIKNTMH